MTSPRRGEVGGGVGMALTASCQQVLLDNL